MPRVLLLIPDHTYRTADFLAAAGRLGVEIVVGAERRPALAHLMEGRYLRLALDDVAGSAARIVSFAATHPLDAVVAVDDGGTLVAAAASAALGLPHNEVAAVAASRDKARTRERLAAAGLPTPGYATHPADRDPARIAASLPYPVVVKPLDLSGSRGVIRADEPDGFVAAFRRVAALVTSPDACGPGDEPQRILVEEFIPGREVAVEGLLRGGRLEILAIFDKPDPLDGPFFEETIYVTPSRLPEATQDEVSMATRRACAALGLAEGPIHAELRLNETGSWVLEVAARSIGGLCARTLRFGADVALEELILRHAARLELPEHQREASAAGVMMLPIPGAGILRAIHGAEDARAVPGVAGLHVTAPIGTPLVPLPEGDRYLGFLLARAETPAQVETALRAAHARLRFDIDPVAIPPPVLPAARRRCAGETD